LAKAKKRTAPRRVRNSQLVRVGNRELETRGLRGGFWTDLYHRSMTVYWPVFFGIAAAIFVFLNVLFAVLYWLGEHPIANVADNGLLQLFYFSIETLATVGYGDMHPQTDYGHTIATVEIFTGMCFLAVMTGLIFARFSRPRARFVFAEHPVVAIHQAQPTLMIRVANARNNTISQATARLWLIRVEYTAEGRELRRFYELKLDRQEHPMFSLTWTILHTIDESSILYGMPPDDLLKSDATLVLNVSGIDDSSAQRMQDRALYGAAEIRWRYRYRDIASTSPNGRLLIDYTKFHEVIPEDA
jgi:inward rectifier potassium channel